MTTEKSQLYDQDYRHFDVLIWQAPTWASAIFTFTMTTAGLLLANLKHFREELKLEPLQTLAVFLLAVFLVLSLLANALTRFRLHQGALPAPEVNVPRPVWQLRGHTSLQLIIHIEASVVLSFGLYCAGAPLQAANLVAAIFLLVGFPALEYWVLSSIKTLRSREA